MENRGQKSLVHLLYVMLVMDYRFFTTEVRKKPWAYPFKNTIIFPLPNQYNVGTKEEVQVLVFKIVCGVGGKVRFM